MELPLSLITISTLSLLLLPSPSAANEANILATGDVLPADGQLSYGGSAFVIQDDCNLVLYNHGNGFQSNTHGFGTNCTLTVSDTGELVVKTAAGGKVWSSTGGSKKGNYAAVLGPDGQVSVYGPSIWSTPPLSSKPAGDGAAGAELSTIPPVRNALFSSQVLYDNAALASRDYRLEITGNCSLEFSKASEGVVWQSGTKGKGRHCFLRLDHRGQLAVVGDNYRVLWTSKPAAAAGEYVLVVEIHGQAVVYGPVVWSTGS